MANVTEEMVKNWPKTRMQLDIGWKQTKDGFKIDEIGWKRLPPKDKE
jgi:hypothetical protein